MDTSIRSRKDIFRHHIDQVFSLMPKEAFVPLHAKLNERIESFIATQNLEIIFGYYPLQDEPDIRPLMEKWLQKGGKLALPLWHGGRDITFKIVNNLQSDLEKSKAGIMEPKADRPNATLEDGLFVLVPGKAFSEEKARMGRGRAAYDSFLAQKKFFKLGICYDFQVFPSIPEGSKDVRVNGVFTPGRKIL